MTIKPNDYYFAVKKAATDAMAHGASPLELSNRLHQLVIGAIRLRTTHTGCWQPDLYETWRDTGLRLEGYNESLLDWACWGKAL